MNSCILTELVPPLDIRSEVSPTGEVSLQLVDSAGVVAHTEHADAATASGAAVALANIRSRVELARLELERASGTTAWVWGAARQPGFGFDGCEPEQLELSPIATFVGCGLGLAIIAALFAGWLALLIAGFTLLVFAIAVLGSAVLLAMRFGDHYTCHLRVVPASQVHSKVVRQRGVALMSPGTYQRFRPKLVCFERLEDRFVLSVLTGRPRRSARMVNAEVLRQLRHGELATKETQRKVEAAQAAVAAIQDRETRRKGK